MLTTARGRGLLAIGAAGLTAIAGVGCSGEKSNPGPGGASLVTAVFFDVKSLPTLGGGHAEALGQSAGAQRIFGTSTTRDGQRHLCSWDAKGQITDLGPFSIETLGDLTKQTPMATKIFQPSPALERQLAARGFSEAEFLGDRLPSAATVKSADGSYKVIVVNLETADASDPRIGEALFAPRRQR